MKIRFKLGNGTYELSGDKYQFLIDEVKVRTGEWNGKGKKPNMDKVGEEYLTNQKTFPTIDMVIRHVYNYEMHTCDAQSFDELFELVKVMQKDIADIKEKIYAIIE